MEYEIIHLSKETWKGTVIASKYTTDKYYDVKVNNEDNGFIVEIEKKSFPEPTTKILNDKLYEEHWENA